MIPLKLEMRNFMCYGEQASSLDFNGIQLACLAGDNGHGKSAIIDAMTWALWGKARAQRDDDLIHMGQKDMGVEFEFLLADNRYRVIRQRTKNGARGRTTLEFQVSDNGRFRSLTGNTMRQTQARIIDTLHMDYDTFINSAFLLQGRADEFTTKPPAERKRILGEILDLSLYDQLEERAKERAKNSQIQSREIAAALSEIEKELSRKSEYESELEEAERDVSQLSQKLRAEENKLRDLREARKELDFKQEQLLELRAELDRRQKELKDTEREIDDIQKHITAYEAMLANQESIEEGYVALVAARRADEELSRKLSEHAKLNEERARLQRHMDEAKSRLSLERELKASKARELTAKAEREHALKRELEQVQARLEKLAERQEQREGMLHEEQQLRDQIASLHTTNDQLKAEMDVLKEKLDLLQEAEATCPLCGSDLADQEREHIKETYESEGRNKGDLYRKNAATIQGLKDSLEEVRTAKQAADEELRALGSLQGEQATLSKGLEEARIATRELEAADGELRALDARLKEGDYARNEGARLAQLDDELAELGYDAQKHEQIREQLTQEARFEEAMRDLEAARQGLKAQQERFETRKRHREQLCQSQAHALDKKEALTQHIRELEMITADLEKQDRLVDELQVSESRARLRLGAAKQKLDHCGHLETQKKGKVSSQREALEEKAIYDELRLAFGKRGIQAMIIEGAIPEIEEEANLLLSRMTDGRMHVRLKSQRETLQGKTVETLDIHVADELGARNYALFSGGEAFRINFALRIALSKLLARRAGARLQTLIIDEGFGTQDSQGRERLVEAINSVSEDFERILVITHIDELKDSFPVRIDVFKTPQGSRIEVR